MPLNFFRKSLNLLLFTIVLLALLFTASACIEIFGGKRTTVDVPTRIVCNQCGAQFRDGGNPDHCHHPDCFGWFVREDSISRPSAGGSPDPGRDSVVKTTAEDVTSTNLDSEQPTWDTYGPTQSSDSPTWDDSYGGCDAETIQCPGSNPWP